MKETFFKIILSVDETINIIVMIISIVSGIAAILSGIKIQKNTWIWKCIFLVSFFIIICTVVRRNITEVPNVVGKTYQDACNILSNNGLNYSQVLDDGAYVMKQNPIAGTIVEKDLQVELTIQERTEGINIQKTEEEVWKSIEVNFTLNNYEQMLKIAEENQLMENEKMLNILGIMYAQGIYYEQDYEKALTYLKAAAVYGELESTFNNLWLASYIADVEKAEDNDISYSNCMEALQIAENHKNHSLDETLRTGIYINFDEKVDDGYNYVKSLSNEDRKELLGIFHCEYKSLKYIVVTDYHYRADVTTNLSTGEIEYDNVVAMPHMLQELEVPVYLFVAGSPMEYELFDDLKIFPYTSQKPIVTEEFEYETSYLDENGNTCYWKDTDEIFYGNEPPETDEKSRWMIMGYEGIDSERRYRKQIKE